MQVPENVVIGDGGFPSSDLWLDFHQSKQGGVSVSWRHPTAQRQTITASLHPADVEVLYDALLGMSPVGVRRLVEPGEQGYEHMWLELEVALWGEVSFILHGESDRRLRLSHYPSRIRLLELLAGVLRRALDASLGANAQPVFGL